MEVFDSLWFPIDPVRTVKLGVKEVNLKKYQTIVWIAIRPIRQFLLPEEREALPDDEPLLPAILDTGHTGTLSLREEHLTESGLERDNWSFDQDHPRLLGDASGTTHLVPTLTADIWLKAENPQDGVATSYCLPVGASFGINVFPSNAPDVGEHFSQIAWDNFCLNIKKDNSQPKHVAGPRLPVLGLAALSSGNLECTFDCRKNGIGTLLKCRG